MAASASAPCRLVERHCLSPRPMRGVGCCLVPVTLDSGYLWRAIAMPTQEEIYTKVSATLVEALNVDEEDVKPSSTLQGDLGAE